MSAPLWALGKSSIAEKPRIILIRGEGWGWGGGRHRNGNWSHVASPLMFLSSPSISVTSIWEGKKKYTRRPATFQKRKKKKKKRPPRFCFWCPSKTAHEKYVAAKSATAVYGSTRRAFHWFYIWCEQTKQQSLAFLRLLLQTHVRVRLPLSVRELSGMLSRIQSNIALLKQTAKGWWAKINHKINLSKSQHSKSRDHRFCSIISSDFISLFLLWAFSQNKVLIKF